MITGDESYLEPYQKSVPVIGGLIRDIRKLTAALPDQQRRVERLEELSTRLIEKLAQSIEVRRSGGFDAARQIAATGEIKGHMDEIRVLGDEMVSEEKRLLVIRQADLHTHELTAQRIILFDGIAG